MKNYFIIIIILTADDKRNEMALNTSDIRINLNNTKLPILYLQHCHLFLNATLHRVSNLNFVHNVDSVYHCLREFLRNESMTY